MDDAVLEGFKNGKFPRLHEMTLMELFVCLPDNSKMSFLDLVYREANALMRVDAQFKKEVATVTLELQSGL